MSLASATALASDTSRTVDSETSLIVHEWGTFTSFSGSDGVKLEFRPLVENDLPRFVLNRANLWSQWFSKASLPAIQRMETPVTYFYTPVERDVTARVAFPQGLLTEFYPPVRSFGPESMNVDEARSKALKDSWLDWGHIHLIPPESLRAHVRDKELSRRIGQHVDRTMTPNADGFEHYAAARDTDSAIVQVRHSNEKTSQPAVALPGDYFEKFLFYRGLGNFDLPLTLTATNENTFTVANSGADEIRSLFLVSVHGEEIAYGRYASLPGKTSLELSAPDHETNVKVLEQEVQQALIAEGLYEKEARAMVNVWKSSWFAEEGTRLFYIVPPRLTDELLPLQITPQPTEQVRVLVGRMEIMPPAQEAEILNVVRASLAARPDLPRGESSPELKTLMKMGRLAEPALVRAENLSTTEPMKQEARRLIEELRRLQTQTSQAG